ncbi:hypothetical protein [Amycolatopsis sp. CA-230715]|uniref:hypothetical protein n=1 Tax=Amycolatopsis sp. CA-230715 TaxID=2745196 RepID=UPI001C026490|nr:hypothetical protein [Amycolatopsis sp. CA-230715]
MRSRLIGVEEARVITPNAPQVGEHREHHGSARGKDHHQVHRTRPGAHDADRLDLIGAPREVR